MSYGPLLVKHGDSRARERHQLIGYQVDEHIRHRAVERLEGEPSQVARTSADATEGHLGHSLRREARDEAVAQVASAVDVDVAHRVVVGPRKPHPLRHAAGGRLGRHAAALGPRDTHSPHHRRAGLQGRAGLRHGRAELHLPALHSSQQPRAGRGGLQPRGARQLDLVLGLQRHVPGRNDAAHAQRPRWPPCSPRWTGWTRRWR